MSVADRIVELRKRYEENPRRFFAPLANEYRKSGDLEQAILLCQEHLVDQPGNMNGHVVYGQALFEAGRFDEAAATFETALSLDPENLIALRHLGDMARDRGDAPKAREWYLRVLDADPRNEEILGFLHQIDAGPASDAEDAPVAPLAEDAVPPPRAPTSPTPVVPYQAVEVESAPPRQTMGLMDLSIDLGLNAEAVFDQTSEPPAAASAPAPEDERPPLADDSFASIGFPDEPAAAATEAPLVAEPVAATGADAAPWPSMEEVPAPSAEEVTSAVSPASGAAEFVVLPTLETRASLETSSAEAEAAAPAPSEPEPAHAEPGPGGATSPAEPEASGTDFLFADTVTDFPTVGGESSAAPEDIGAQFDVDAVIGRTPAAGIEKIEPLAETPQPFVNETMAELYLQQGFRDEALQVYRQLSAQNPHDDSLRERIASLERGGRSSLSFEVVHEEKLDVAEGAVPLGAMLEMTPHEVVEEAHLHPHAAEPVRTARAFFAELAVRRAVASGVAPSANGAAPVTPDAVGPGAGALDTMFGGAIGDEDEARALTLASVAEGVEHATPAVKGRPTQAAETELSLDSVFRDAPRRSSGSVPRQSQTLRFDQFFSAAADTAGAADASGGEGTAATGSGDAAAPDRPAAPSAGEPGSPADLEHFQSWLSGLKMP